LKGAYYVKFFEPFPVEKISSLYVEKEGEMRSIEIETAENSSGAWIFSFRGEDEDLAGSNLFADKWNLEEGDFWKQDLMGCLVYNSRGFLMGVVSEIENSLPQVWVTLNEPDGKTFSFPFIKKFVKEVLIKDKKIIADVPEGVGVRGG